MGAPARSSSDVRSALVARLRTDLLGPAALDEEFTQDREAAIGDAPSTRYLVGILSPSNSRVGAEEDDFGLPGGEDDEDDEAEEETPTIITGIPRPSSIGITFAVDRSQRELDLEFAYGLYSRHENVPSDGGPSPGPVTWRRRQVRTVKRVQLAGPQNGNVELEGSARGEWYIRTEPAFQLVTIFLRNARRASPPPERPEDSLYQVEIHAKSPDPGVAPFVSRTLWEHYGDYDADLESYKLLYRDRPEFCTGHGCAGDWDSVNCPPDRARSVRSEVLPSHHVESFIPSGGLGLAALDMGALSNLTPKAGPETLLEPLAAGYEDWIRNREAEIPGLHEALRPRALQHLADCREALGRIRDGIGILRTDPLALEAFRFANSAMLLQRQKTREILDFVRGRKGSAGSPPKWRPFQLAFILMNLRGSTDQASADRRLVDLLWFPTGGGKTEAYLGLAAFVIALRRLRATTGPEPKFEGDGGTTVLMRYTLRLLTIQQFQRAATLICACETLRRKEPRRFGKIPISIGLWVGGSTTPNHIDRNPDGYFQGAPGALQVLQSITPGHEPAEGNPIQLRSCPWCGHALGVADYTVYRELQHLRIRCPNNKCAFHGPQGDPFAGLPAYLVDDDLYLRCPTLVIATVDKFARLPWQDEARSLFGKVDRHCVRHHFLAQGVEYEWCNLRHRASGEFIETGLPRSVKPFVPPELIIQDELHLITGPLGSLMGIYESAVDFLCAEGLPKGPKVIASTATIRRARDQIRDLFGRDSRLFPPPGLIAGDSFFAAEAQGSPGRLYVGVAAPGRSVKTAAIRTVASVLDSGARERASAGSDVSAIDPYWTVVFYFNSLRELGGALRIIDDDVRQRLAYLATLDGGRTPRIPERRPELTSRVPSAEIPKLLAQMETPLPSADALDVLLCTNMLSVGVDVQRFGLMAVNGQPKTSAEYIQATSRIGRAPPGLVLTIVNWSRPRDMSHYERFRAYHSMLYRHVEASSITPFSPRSRDKAIHAVLLSALRLSSPNLANNDGASNFVRKDPIVARAVDAIIARVHGIDQREEGDARAQIDAFLAQWEAALVSYPDAVHYQTSPEAAARFRALIQAAEEGSGPNLPRGTLNSMREVEKSSYLYYGG